MLMVCLLYSIQFLLGIGQGSKIALVRSYLRVPQAAGQVKILIVLVKITFLFHRCQCFCDAGQVLILRYFEACRCLLFGVSTTLIL